MLQKKAVSKAEEFSVQDFLDSYNVGAYSNYLKVYSAFDKGRKFNKRRILRDAIKFPYIQPNSKFNISWLVFDVDRNFDFNEINDKNLCIPNFIVWNNENNHAQIWYKLRDPIWIQKQGKSKAYNYQKAVYEGIRAVLDADKHFNRSLCKNPFYEGQEFNWTRVDFTRHEYSLIELCNHIDINFQIQKEKENEKSGFIFSMENAENFSGAEKGNRNSSLFDFCRYSIYKYFTASNCSEEDLFEYSKQFIATQNTYNNPPLNDRECEAMAKSISSWTYNNLTPRGQKKEKYDDRSRERSLITRRKKQQKKLSKIRKFMKINPSASNRVIAAKLGYSLGSVNSYVNKILKLESQKKNARENKEIQNAQANESRFFSKQKKPFSEHFVNQFVCEATENKKEGEWKKSEFLGGTIYKQNL